VTFQYLKGVCKQEDQLFMHVNSDGTREHDFKLKERKCRLDVRQKLFTQRVVRPWHRLPREAVDAPIPGGVQGWDGWGPGQPALLCGSPVHCRGR